MQKDQRYPLSWPFGWKRAELRRSARFSSRSNHGRSALSVADGFDRLEREFDRLKAYDVVVSTNLQLGMRGSPLSSQPEPKDPGVAAYFVLGGKERVLACDTWDRVADNMAAIAAHIECIRGIERYGVGTMEQAFTGYDALPPPSEDNRPQWRQTLGFKPMTTVTRDDVNVNYKTLAKAAANDQHRMVELNLAREAAFRELV